MPPVKYVDIELTVPGVVSEDGEDLLREDNPHTVSEPFAVQLFHHNQAEPAGAADARRARSERVAKSKTGTKHGDPSLTTRE